MSGKEIQNDIIVIWILHCTVTGFVGVKKEGSEPLMSFGRLKNRLLVSD